VQPDFLFKNINNINKNLYKTNDWHTALVYALPVNEQKYNNLSDVKLFNVITKFNNNYSILFNALM
jgi:hypothetical protein